MRFMGFLGMIRSCQGNGASRYNAGDPLTRGSIRRSFGPCLLSQFTTMHYDAVYLALYPPILPSRCHRSPQIGAAWREEDSSGERTSEKPAKGGKVECQKPNEASESRPPIKTTGLAAYLRNLFS